MRDGHLFHSTYIRAFSFTPKHTSRINDIAIIIKQIGIYLFYTTQDINFAIKLELATLKGQRAITKTTQLLFVPKYHV